ncbi:hypothetical protein KCP75_21955 [Salmonella enterica subsp. enterica]|nr:hypothetical protein KCP75_21955 [Salmonella enterica subsp. enterica]
MKAKIAPASGAKIAAAYNPAAMSPLSPRPPQAPLKHLNIPAACLPQKPFRPR